MKLCSKVLMAAVAAVLLVPASAMAQSATGTVLQIDRHHHVIRVVTGLKEVNSYRYRGRLKGVKPGSRVRIVTDGHRAARVRPVGRARSVQVYGRVMSASSRGATFSLPDGRAFSIGARAAHPRGVATAAQNVSVNVEGLKPGQTVLITVSFDANGDLHISIKLVDEPGSGDDTTPPPPECGDATAKAGTVVGINNTDGLLTISRPWGEDPQTYHASSEQLSHVHNGDEVLVRFDPESSQASDVKIVHSTVTAPDPSVLVADGTVNSTNADAGQFTVVQSNRNGRLTFNAPCWILNQVWPSEGVHVVYHTEANGDTVADTVDANDGSEFEH